MSFSAPILLGLGLTLGTLLALLLWVPLRPRGAGLTAFLGAFLIAYPMGRFLAGALNVADRLTHYTVLLPATLADFERQVLHDAAFGVLLPLGGALLLWRRRAGSETMETWRDLLPSLARVLEPAGLRLARPSRGQLLDALAVLGLALGLLALSFLAQALLPFLVTGDESQYWTHLTPAMLVGLSVAAGVSEEFLFRGLLLRALRQRLPWLPAMLLQALLFGFIHSGYGNWAHVLGPALFALLMGLVATRVGLLAAMMVHAGVDIAYLALAAPQLQPAVYALPALLCLAGLAALASTRGRAVRKLLQRPPAARARGHGAPGCGPLK